MIHDDVRPISESDSAIAGLYDHELEAQRARDWGGDDLFTQAPPRRRRFERPAAPPRLRDHADTRPAERPEPVASQGARPLDSPEPQAASKGRRTVTITGNPGGVPVYRRPPRTIDEHFARRPERIASWTCALGALSILLAIVTAQ